jgi:predicted acylesterase/phospholipase RssA
MAAFLAGVAPFLDFPPDVLLQVASHCSVRRVRAGEWLFRQRDEGDALYIVGAGRVELVREDPGTPPQPVGILGPGEALGELALLLGEPRSLSARAIRDSELVRLHRGDVIALLRDSAEFTAGLTRVLAHYLQDRALARGLADAQGTVLTVVSLHPAAPIADLRAAMAAIPARRRVTVLDGTGLSAPYGGALDRAERDHDRVFLLAGAPDAPPGWDEFCLRQADRVIALVPPELGVPDPTAQRPELDGCDLVFWSPPDRTRNVVQWLDRLRPRSHHFVDPAAGNLVPTVARALRRLAGLSVGVVLSGGGARSLAQIGALAGLLEAGVPVDRIGGSSFGAFVGAMFALGMTPDEMKQRCRREFVSSWPFNDYTVPKVALIRGRKLRAALERTFGPARIEESPLDFFAVSADLSTSDLVVHRRGLFTHALAASLALPGMLPPVADDGRLLIDGSALSGLPVQVMADVDEGPIVAVDVVGSRLRVRAREPRLPTIVETISRSVILGGSSGAAAARSLARLVIEPDTLATGQLDFNRIDALVEAGRLAALDALANAGDLLASNVAFQTAGDGG